MKKQFMLIDADGDQVWYLDTRDRSDEVLSEGMDVYELCWHRPEGPAVVWSNGSQSWYVNGKRHRTDGPAVSRSDGIKLWFVNNKQYRDNKSFQEAAGITDEEMSFMIIKYGDVNYN